MSANVEFEKLMREGKIKAVRSDGIDELIDLLNEKKEPDCKKLLNNLLAVIHRDGGHYSQEHGLEKSTRDAVRLTLNERHEAEEIKYMYENNRK